MFTRHILENDLYYLYKSEFTDNHYIIRKSDEETMECLLDNNTIIALFEDKYDD